MYRKPSRLITTLALAAALLLGVGASPKPAAAQGGSDSVTFWNDAGLTDATARIPSPGYLANYVYLNPNGGRTPTDGLLVIVGSKQGDMIIRDRDQQVFTGSGGAVSDHPLVEFGLLGWTLVTDGACISERIRCGSNTDPSLGTVLSPAQDFDTSTVTLTQNGPTTWKAKKVLVKTVNAHTYTVTVTYSYTPPSALVYLEAQVSVSPGYSGAMNLYLASDLALDGVDEGPGTGDYYGASRVVMQYNETSAGGIGEGVIRPFDSYYEGYHGCGYDRNSLKDCGNSAEHWAVDETSPDHWFGPAFAKPYPMPAIINGRGEDETEEDIDAGIAGHWDVTTNRKVDVYYVFTTRDDLLSNLSTTPQIEPTEEIAPAFCQQPPTLAIKPDPLEIAAGGAATVWVELVNPCRDLPTAPVDVLLSLSDGLTVIETSAGVLNLGRRAALQRFSLDAGAMHGWYAIVRADDPFVSAPMAVAEIYAGAAVVRTDTRSFTTPTAAPAPAAPAPAPEPAPAPAAPAALPVALPNTAGAALPLGLLAVAAAAAFTLGRRFSR